MAKIGLPSLKLNNAGVKSKSCGSFRSVAEEALKERKGHDPDIDRKRSTDNIYTGYQTAEELMEYSRMHVQELKDKSGRGIRKDAVVMCVTVLKPPADFMNRLSRSEQLRFLRDAEKAFVEIVGRDNIKSTAIHFDELGAHEHVFWEPMTADGRLCAKEVHNLQFFGRVNRELPEKLREAGWEIEDCQMYDAAKEDYAKERAKSGMSSVQFKAEAEREKRVALEMANEMCSKATEARQELSEACKELSSVKSEIKALDDRKAALRGDIENMEGTKKRVTEAAVRAHKVVQEYTPKLKELSLEKEELSRIIPKMREQKTEMEREISGLKDRIHEAESELDTVESAIKRKMDEAGSQFSQKSLEEAIRKEKEQKQLQSRMGNLERMVEQFQRFLEAVPIAKGLFSRWLSDERKREGKDHAQDKSGHGKKNDGDILVL